MDFPLLDNDEADSRLLSHVHPEDWENPSPKKMYNLVAIGAGTAGLVSAVGAQGLGADCALIESHLMGGDCLNYGCVPSKALIAAAKAFHDAKNISKFGGTVGELEVDFGAVMARMRELRADISHHDSAERFAGLGVDVFLGKATFTSPSTLVVGGEEIRFRRAVIATGAKAWAPPIPGLDDYLTNETVFTLTELPSKMAVIGSGPIGCELAQTFARFGTEVTVLEIGDQILGREDRDAAAIVQQQMESDGVEFKLKTKTEKVAKSDGAFSISVVSDGEPFTLEVDKILVATGRRANVDGLGLENAKVKTHKRGIEVNDFLRTSNPKIYAAGDCCSRYQFTHTADAQARIVIQNALFANTTRMSDLVIPWATYTDPEIAHVGLYEEEAQKEGFDVTTFRTDFDSVDRAILESETKGFMKVHVKAGTDTILGATIVGAHAGDLISEVTLAMRNDIGLGGIGGTIHPYPTRAEIAKKTADQYNRTRLSPKVSSILKTYFGWRR